DIGVLVAGLFNGFAERRVDLRDPRAKQVLKADQKREFDSLLTEILNDFEEIDTDGISNYRTNLQVTFGIDAKIRFPPELDAIQLFGILNSPGFFFSHLFIFRRS